MKIYAKHLFGRICIAFLVTNALILGMLSLMQLIKFSYVLQFGSLIDLLYVIYLSLPSLLFVVLPVTAALASIYTYSVSIKHSEITILQKLGLSRLRIVSPSLVFGLLAVILSLYVGFFLGPKSFGGMQNKLFNIQTTYSISHLNENSFNKLGQMQAYIGERLSDDTFKDVLIFDTINSNIYVAQKAKFSLDNPYLFIKLYQGKLQNEQSSTLTFDKFVVTINLDEYRNKKSPHKGIMTQVLGHLIADKTPRALAEIHKRTLWSMYSFLLVIVVLSSLFSGAKLKQTFIYLTSVVMLFLFFSGIASKHLISIYIHYITFGLILLVSSLRLIREV